VLVSAVRVVSTPELVGVHAKGGGKRFRDLHADRQTMEVEAERGCWGMGRRELGLLSLSKKNGLRNLFGFIDISSPHEARSR